MIKTNRLILRPWRDEDVEFYAAMNADPVVMEFYPAPFSKEVSAAAIDKHRRTLDETGIGMFCVEDRHTSKFVGAVGLVSNPDNLPFSPCVEIGWRLVPEYWGKGLAYEAALAALDHGFEQIGLKEIVSFTSTINHRSWGLMEKLRMKKQADTFNHPNVKPGHILEEHVLYRLTREEHRAYKAVEASGYELPKGWVELGFFGDSPEMSDKLLEPIRSGLKRATCSLLWEYEHSGEEYPKVGDYEVVMNSKELPEFVIRYTEVEIHPYEDVSADFARAEGEGDLSLEYWRRVHWNFFTKVCSWINKAPSQTMPLVCTRFEVVHTL